MKNINILFICIANHCRSPVAEILAKKKFREYCHIESCGLIEPISIDMHKSSKHFLSNHCSIDHFNFKAKKVSDEVLKNSNYIIVFTSEIKIMLIKNFPYVASKVFLLTKFSSKEDIQDPINKNRSSMKK